MEYLEILEQVFLQLGEINIHFKMIIIFLGVPIMYLGRKWATDKSFRDEILNYSLRLFKRNAMSINLLDHFLFRSKGIYSIYINNITLDSKIKNNIFSIILGEKSASILTMCSKYIKDNLPTINDIDLNLDLTTLMDTIVLDYEVKIKAILITEYKEDGEFLYKYVYTDRFKAYHNKNLLFIVTTIAHFSQSRLTNEQKIYIFLNLTHTALELAILDCEKVFDEINGQLKKYNEKWHKIQ